jgi:hypothetical protein
MNDYNRDSEMRERYPVGIDSAGILTEIRRKFGKDAFPLISILDIHDEMDEAGFTPLRSDRP